MAYVAKTQNRNLSPHDAVRLQLAKRLRQLRAVITTLSAEAEMIEHLLADAEKRLVVPTLKLRKNSKGKWTAQGQVRRYLTDHPGPVKAQAIYDFLKGFDPSLNSSTFRSHLRRMVESGMLKRDGPRGHYQLAERPKLPENERFLAQRPKITIRSRGL